MTPTNLSRMVAYPNATNPPIATSSATFVEIFERTCGYRKIISVPSHKHYHRSTDKYS